MASIAAVSAICLLLAPGARAQPASELRWGGDPEGGAPFVEADPNDPTHLVGFDVEVVYVPARIGSRAKHVLFLGKRYGER